ncbi:hypothetical protein PMAYCL1PPCAC_30789, partial [Pristionchus mayeri]
PPLKERKEQNHRYDENKNIRRDRRMEEKKEKRREKRANIDINTTDVIVIKHVKPNPHAPKRPEKNRLVKEERETLDEERIQNNVDNPVDQRYEGLEDPDDEIRSSSSGERRTKHALPATEDAPTIAQLLEPMISSNPKRLATPPLSSEASLMLLAASFSGEQQGCFSENNCLRCLYPRRLSTIYPLQRDQLQSQMPPLSPSTLALANSIESGGTPAWVVHSVHVDVRLRRERTTQQTGRSTIKRLSGMSPLPR